MNLQTVEIFLPCYRAGRRMDPRIARAARVAEGDELLRGKLAAQTRFDEQMIEAIHTIKTPEGFRARLDSAAASPALRKHARHPAILCAVAGTLLIIGFLVYLELDRRSDFPGKENAESMLTQLERMDEMDFEPVTGPISGLTDWFMLRGIDGLGVPPEVAALQAAYARTFKKDGQSVAQLVINQHSSILTIFRASDFNVRLDPNGDWKFFEKGEWSAAIRQRGDTCTFFALRGSPADIKEFIRSLTP
jgi:hypothetical protein